MGVGGPDADWWRVLPGSSIQPRRRAACPGIGSPLSDDGGGSSMGMTAAVLTGHGDRWMIEVRRDVAVPVPDVGQVRVRVTAASVNNTDVWSRRGSYGTADDPDAVAGWRGVPLSFPRIQGADVVGTVEALGGDVDDDLAGRRVLLDPAVVEGEGEEPDLVGVLGSELDGGFATHVVVPADRVHDVADSPLSDVELACLPIAYGTAMGMLDRAGLVAGETVVVTGASGGVGLALVQLAVARGARVVGVTSEAGRELVAGAGAVATVDRHGDVAAEVGRAVGGEVDVVADVVGGWMLPALLDLVATGGRWVVAGAVAGPVVRLDLRQLYLRSRRLVGSTMHTPAQFRRLVDEARAGRVRPHVEATFPLEEIHAAQEAFGAPGRRGKVVLLPPT